MPEQIRALIFIFIIVSVPIYIFQHFSRKIGFYKDVKHWTIAWAVVTFLAFTVPSFWIFAAFISIYLIYITKDNHVNKICLFFVLLPSLPSASIRIPGFGLINFLMDVNFPILLSVVLLIPLIFQKNKNYIAFKSLKILIFTYLALLMVAHFRDSTMTDTLRHGVGFVIIMVIPYLAISKSLRTSEDINKVFLAIIFGIFIQAVVGLAETVKNWHLYNAAVASLGLDWGFGGYQSRNNLLRASAALGHSIALGYIIVIGLGLLFKFFPYQKRNLIKIYWLNAGILFAALLATLSRGPWMGAIVMIVFYILSGRKAVGKLAKLFFVGLFSLSILSFFPIGQSFIKLLPYMDDSAETHTASTISYRERLFEQSWIVIQQNPLLGSSTYLETPEMQSMMQGEGIIDIVNSYLRIALETGLVGLSVFLLIFIITLAQLYKIIQRMKRDGHFPELLLQGRSLFAVIIGIMLTIFTVSGVSLIPVYYWSVLGVSAAFIGVVRFETFKYYSTPVTVDSDFKEK